MLIAGSGTGCRDSHCRDRTVLGIHIAGTGRVGGM